MYRTTIGEERNKSTTKYLIEVVLLQQKVSADRILLVERLVGESQCEMTELSVAGDALQMELIDVLVESSHVSKLDLTNGAVGNQAGGSYREASPPISKLLR